MILKRVLFIPYFHHNLLFVNKLTKTTGFMFIFYPDFCLLQDKKTSRQWLLANGLVIYTTLEFTSFKSETLNQYDSHSCIHVSNFLLKSKVVNYVIETLTSWRSGHPFLIVLQKLYFEVNKEDLFTKPSDICARVKQTRVSFESSNSYSDILFELIHVDVLGPYN